MPDVERFMEPATVSFGCNYSEEWSMIAENRINIAWIEMDVLSLDLDFWLRFFFNFESLGFEVLRLDLDSKFKSKFI